MKAIIYKGIRLTETQLKILPLLGRGFSNAEIGEHLDLTTNTITTYTEQASRQVEGNLPARTRMIVWWRLHHGLDPLTGESVTDRDSAK